MIQNVATARAAVVLSNNGMRLSASTKMHWNRTSMELVGLGYLTVVSVAAWLFHSSIRPSFYALVCRETGLSLPVGPRVAEPLAHRPNTRQGK
jgi:hypothetical protein